MFLYRELSEPTNSAERNAEWVDFPPSSKLDPWAALMEEANCLPNVSAAKQGATHRIAPLGHSRAHRAAGPETAAKNG